MNLCLSLDQICSGAPVLRKKSARKVCFAEKIDMLKIFPEQTFSNLFYSTGAPDLFMHIFPYFPFFLIRTSFLDFMLLFSFILYSKLAETGLQNFLMENLLSGRHEK